jgi:hypothetical protein
MQILPSGFQRIKENILTKFNCNNPKKFQIAFVILPGFYNFEPRIGHFAFVCNLTQCRFSKQLQGLQPFSCYLQSVLLKGQHLSFGH